MFFCDVTPPYELKRCACFNKNDARALTKAESRVIIMLVTFKRCCPYLGGESAVVGSLFAVAPIVCKKFVFCPGSDIVLWLQKSVS